MELSKFLTFCGLFAGFGATVFLSRALLPSPDEVLRGMVHYSPVGWPSVQIIADRAAERADTIASLFLVGLALLFQLFALSVREDTQIAGNVARSVLLASALVGVIIVTIWQVDIALGNSQAMRIRRVAARDYVKRLVEASSVPLYRDVEAIASQYFALRRNDEESPSEFLKRFASYVSYQVPENADLSKFR